MGRALGKRSLGIEFGAGIWFWEFGHGSPDGVCELGQGMWEDNLEMEFGNVGREFGKWT